MSDAILKISSQRPTLRNLMNHVISRGGTAREIEIEVDGQKLPHVEFTPGKKGHGKSCIVAGTPDELLSQLVVQHVFGVLHLY